MKNRQADICPVDWLSLQKLSDQPVDQSAKGLPFGARVSSSQVKAEGWNLIKGDLPFPLLTLKEAVLEDNLQTMAEWCERNRLLLAPHGKTTMCPQIFARQIAHGAWAITVANPAQAAVCLRFGITRILIANQVAGAANMRALAAMLNHQSQPELYCLADSIEGVKQLAAGLDRYGARRPINVLIEWGRDGWRTGVRSLEQGLGVYAEAARHAGRIRVRGVEAFEGLASSPEGADGEARIVDQFLDGLRFLAERLRGELPGDDLPLLSAGGSAFLDRILLLAQAAGDQFRFVVRSGCYATHDHFHYQQKQEAWISRSGNLPDLPRFIPAFELWSCVQSVPQPDRAILNFGKRDCSYDLELPMPLFALAEGRPISERRELKTAQITKLNDQHAYLDFSGPDRLDVGELVCCGISHPCTSFDKWRILPVVNHDYDVIDLYHTLF